MWLHLGSASGAYDAGIRIQRFRDAWGQLGRKKSSRPNLPAHQSFRLTAPIFPTSIVAEDVWLIASLIRILLLAQWCPHYKGPALTLSWPDDPLGYAYALREQELGTAIIRAEMLVSGW